MKPIYLRFVSWLVTIILAIAGALLAVPATAQSSIEGTWRLVSRQLPDGISVKPPDVQGIMSLANGHRNHNTLWRTPDGKWASFSATTTYMLSDIQYTETLLFGVFNDPTSGMGVQYFVSGPTRKGPVRRENHKIRIEAPFDQVTWSFEEDNQTTTFPGGIVDYWERVK
jgi:hypothetical protein